MVSLFSGDIMRYNNKLNENFNTKRHFDVDSVNDIEEYKFYLKNNKWKNACPFIVEWPFLNAEKMIETRIVNKFMEEKQKSKVYDCALLNKHFGNWKSE